MVINERQFGLGEIGINPDKVSVEKTVISLKELFPNGFSFVFLTDEQLNNLKSNGSVITDGDHSNIFDWHKYPSNLAEKDGVSLETALARFLSDEPPQYFDYCHSEEIMTAYNFASIYQSRKAAGKQTLEAGTPALVFIDHAIDSRDWIDIRDIEIKRNQVHSVIRPKPEELVFWNQECDEYYESRLKEAREYIKSEYPEITTDEEADEASPYIRGSLIGMDAEEETTDRLIGVMVRNFLIQAASSN